mgnify:CR=1 FL=1
MNEYKTNQPIGSTVGNNPICPDCLPYDKCAKHPSNKTAGGLLGAMTPQDKLTPVNPTVTHLMDCDKLYGNLCSCGADHKTPTNNCGEKHCSRIHPDESPKRNLEQQLCNVLINHTGEHGQNEGAVECLERIIRERDLLLKRAIEVMLKPAHY